MSLLEIRDLHIAIGERPIVRGIDLRVGEGEIHAIMGPNGSGKSTLVSLLMGHPAYTATRGSVLFKGIDLLSLAPEERAAAGLFLAFQYPKEISGVTLRNFLFAASNALKAARGAGKRSSPVRFKKLLEEKMRLLSMDPSFADRFLNKGFSGGEKKKAEVLQMHILEPSLALLDETDSGLDIDALRIVSEGVNALKGPRFSALVVTHYARILDFLEPGFVHVMVAGRIVESGDAALAKELEKGGYAKYGVGGKRKIRLNQGLGIGEECLIPNP